MRGIIEWIDTHGKSTANDTSIIIIILYWSLGLFFVVCMDHFSLPIVHFCDIMSKFSTCGKT